MKFIHMAMYVALLSSVPVSGAFGADELLRVGDWKVERTEKAVYYWTNGQIVSGHEFGFFKLYNYCDQDLISISLSSDNKDVMNHRGTSPEFGLAFKQSNEFVTMPIKYLTYKAVHEKLIIMSFTNTEVTDSFIELVQNNPRVLVKLTDPVELSSLMDVAVEAFVLKDFSKAKIEAMKLCRKGPI